MPTASIRSAPRWHISMMAASLVGLHIMWPCSADTAAAGIEPGREVPEYHGPACGGRHLSRNHSTMMINCATTTPVVRKPQATCCAKPISRKLAKPSSAIALPGSIANSNPIVARAAKPTSTLTMASLPSRVVLPCPTPPDYHPSRYTIGGQPPLLE